MRTPTAVVVVWLFFAACAGWLAGSDHPVAEGRPLGDAAGALEGWTWRESTFTKDQDLLENRVRPLSDDAIVRTYESRDGVQIEVQVFYCASRRPKNRLVYYLDTIQCLHGHYPQVRKDVVSLPKGLEAARLRLSGRSTDSTVLYWIASAGRTSSEWLPHAAWLYGQDLLGRRTDGCFLKLAYYGQSGPAKDAALADLAGKLHVDLAAWLRERKTVKQAPLAV